MSNKLDDNLNITANYCQASGSNLVGNFSDTTLSVTAGGTTGASGAVNCVTTGWNWWTDYYYPQVIRQSYPVYIQERAQDKGKQAFEIIKMLKDKRFVKLETVADFVDAMDALIKIL